MRGCELLKDTVEIKRSNMARGDVKFDYSCIAKIKYFRNQDKPNTSNNTEFEKSQNLE